jgi:hypothetical protein
MCTEFHPRELQDTASVHWTFLFVKRLDVLVGEEGGRVSHPQGFELLQVHRLRFASLTARQTQPGNDSLKSVA